VSFLGEKKGWVGRNVELAVKVRDKSLAGHLLEKIFKWSLLHSTIFPKPQNGQVPQDHRVPSPRERGRLAG
jgi:hypothetical protein